MFTHEDKRRRLIEWSGGKVSKVLIAKQDCIVGDHYHRRKEERFLLLSGMATVIAIADHTEYHVIGPREFVVPANTYHRFELTEGTVLLGVASEEFDPTDEISGQPISSS